MSDPSQLAKPREMHREDRDGNPTGGVSVGPGHCITWQDGPFPMNDAGEPTERNGAVIIDVLISCYARLEHFQASRVKCPENEEAIVCVTGAIAALNRHLARRREAVGVFGTHDLRGGGQNFDVDDAGNPEPRDLGELPEFGEDHED